MVIFVDLDGTLTHTADVKYKEYKDGLRDFNPTQIPLFHGSVDFILTLKNDGHRVIILSDSHPKYVRPIVEYYFNVEYLYLADKPNTAKTLSFIQSDVNLDNLYKTNKEDFMIIGDSVLDIQLGRKLKILTSYIQLYTGGDFSETDGVGDYRSIIKYGPTFITKSYQELLNIVSDRQENLLSIEAASIGRITCKSVKFWDYRDREHQRIVAFRCLARQENGSCDKFSKADLYYQIDNPQRKNEDLAIMAKGVENYLQGLQQINSYKWDYFTYVSDKSSTTPPNKLKEIFDLISTSIPKIKLFEWDENMTSSLRNEKDYHARQSFIRSHLHIKNSDASLERKNIIVLDDQLTTGATAFEIRKKLEEQNVGNILIVTLFYMSLLVLDDKICPRCGKPLVIKTNRRKGTKFYSCQPPQFGGDGCGYIENID